MKGLLTLAGLLLAALAADAQDLRRIERSLKDAVERENLADTEEAVRGFLVANNAKAAERLASIVRRVGDWTENESVYWILVKGLASFSNPDPLRKVGEFVVKHRNKPLARDIMFMVQSNYSISCLDLLRIVLVDGSDGLKAMAADHMGVLQVSRTVPDLIRALKADPDPGLVRRIARALYAISGRNLGTDAALWETWWQKHGAEATARKAGKRAPGVLGRLDRARANDIARVKETAPEKIVVIRGGPHDPGETKRVGGELDHNFDHIEKTLEKLGIPHLVVTKEEFENDFDLAGRRMVLINCTQWREHCVCPDCESGRAGDWRMSVCVCKKSRPVHIPKAYKLSDEAVKRLKAFVDGGGYLFTEDWVLPEVLTRAWPGHLKVGQYMDEDRDVPVLPKAGATSHPYLARIFARPPKLVGEGTRIEAGFEELKHTWKIDATSPRISVVDDGKVEILLQSDPLGVNSAVAVTWISGGGKEELIGTHGAGDMTRWTGGRVLHVLSHFGKQKSQDDEYTLLNLLLNFLIEADQRR